MIFITVNGYMGGGAAGMGDQYREQSPCLHLGPILVLVSGVHSIFKLCIFFVAGGWGSRATGGCGRAAGGRGTRAAPARSGRAALVGVWFAM
jgi:uncharacterized protein YqgC (DUF456 family)